MPNSEQLLQELVNLKKEELRRAKSDRIINFIFKTLPSFLFFVLMVWGSYQVYLKTMDFFENMPDFSQNPSMEDFANFLQ
jgi:hypothetical protein